MSIIAGSYEGAIDGVRSEKKRCHTMDSIASQEKPSGGWVLSVFKQFQDAFSFIFVIKKLRIEP